MRWPLWDEDCREVPRELRRGAATTSWARRGFHELAVHNVELGVGCVECHRAHAGRRRSRRVLPGHAARCARSAPAVIREFAQGG